ncbi:MAG: type II 3-dehydroquinate dehydratase [SAR202 cluster bacterium]|nr:type II 3-dehydroquinate dehydratase [SAR202 cluster bacterium]
MKILVINGPNLNMLGTRNPAVYGGDTLAEIEDRIRNKAADLGVDVDFFQSNHEGALVDHLQGSARESAGIVMNAGALTHYGLSLRDALADSRLPAIEVHLSNIHSREEFRRRSVLSSVVVGQIAGLGWRGYLYALDYLVAHISEEEAGA